MVEGPYELRRLNGEALPYDHPGVGCCTYLSGTLTLDRAIYALAITAQNRNSRTVFTAIEWGKYTRQVSSLTFAPDSFDVSPLLLATGTASIDSVRVVFGGEGPGSPDQLQSLFVGVP